MDALAFGAPVEPLARDTLLQATRRAALMAAVERHPEGATVRVLVRVGPDGISALTRSGAVVGARAGDIVTARVPLDAVPALLTDPRIRSMEAAATLGTLAAPGIAANDSATADAGFEGLRRRVGQRWEGLSGRGVIVGVYDSGLDLAHEDFHRPDGTSRVLFAWDQTAAGGGPGAVGEATFEYGVECTAGVIDAGACPMIDRVGHGTHVTGIAAGDGSATGNGRPAFRFAGGAPEAELIIVKGGDGTFTGDRLLDGVAYIFGRAAALGRPAVVNVSLTSQSGPHDGTTLLERALDALSGPGRIVVSGAGNAGDHRNALPPTRNGPFHARGGPGPATHTVRIPAYTPRPGDANDGVLLELWYDGEDSLDITVRTPAGDAATAVTGDSASVVTAGGAAGIQNALGGADPENGDHGALIAILDLDAAAPPDTGAWMIEVTPRAVHATGRYHLWLTGHSLDAARGPVLEGGTTNAYLVGVPASADRVLAAGAHVTRHHWVGLGGEPQGFPTREPMGDIAYFSSPGPRRDGVQKPDLTAPGKIVISSLSADAMLWDPFPWLIEEDGVHVGLLGTSMASPLVAAAAALLLQIDPALGPDQVRELLRLSAATDGRVPAALPDPAWGYGKLDAGAAARRLRPQGLAGEGQPVNLSANPVRGQSLVINYEERPRSVAVYTLLAERVRGFGDAEIGPLSIVWPLDADGGRGVANGAYVLVVEFADRRVLRKILVARP